jgi:hypothetical protein
MKQLLSLYLSLMSMNVCAQSYLIMGNGITLSTDKAGFVYDFGHFTMPNTVGVNGGQFFVADERLNTVDEKGFIYKKDNKFKKIKGKGLNYLVGDDNALYTIDAKGFVYKFDKDANIRRASGFGGNYFTVTQANRSVELYTVNSKGNYFKMSIEGLNAAQITTFGGSFFRANGVIYTVDQNGLVFAKPEVKVGEIRRAGGNFFIDSTGTLFTISEQGFLIIPNIPGSLNTSNISRVGANYILDQEGKMFAVDSTGAVLERVVREHDLRHVRTLSI